MFATYPAMLLSDVSSCIPSPSSSHVVTNMFYVYEEHSVFNITLLSDLVSIFPGSDISATATGFISQIR